MTVHGQTRWWVARRPSYDIVDVFCVQDEWVVDEDNLRPKLCAHRALDRDGRWVDVPEGSLMDPCLSIPGFIAYAAAQDAGLDDSAKYVHEIVRMLWRTYQALAPSEPAVVVDQ